MKPSQQQKSALSRNTLARIHIAKRDLNLDEHDYRDLLQRITGSRSARDIMPDQIPALQREFRRLGWTGYLREWTPDGPKKFADLNNRPGFPNAAQLRMLEARFMNLKGFADTNPVTAFRAFLQNRFRTSDIRMLDDEKYEAALTAVKRLEQERGVKEEYPSGSGTRVKQSHMPTGYGDWPGKRRRG